MANNCFCCVRNSNRVRALVPTILDSCQQCIELVQTVSVPIPPSTVPFVAPCADPLEATVTIPVSVCGKICASEINNVTNCNEKATTVLISEEIGRAHV